MLLTDYDVVAAGSNVRYGDVGLAVSKSESARKRVLYRTIGVRQNLCDRRNHKKYALMSRFSLSFSK